MHPALAAGVELLAQQVGPPALVVDVADEGVLDGDPAARRLEVAVGGIDRLVDRPPGVDRHELVAQLVVGGVQRQGQGHRDALGRQLVDARYEADGRHRDAASREAEPVGRRVGEPPDGPDRRFVVGQRLSHAHEHDVADPQRRLAVSCFGGRVTPGEVTATQRAGRPDDLLDDLAG